MTRDEAHQLLVLAAAIDRRTVGEIDILAWHSILNRIDFQRGVEALTKHRINAPGVWLEPGHIYQLAKTTTDSAASTGQLQATECEHGTFCGTCKGVHHAHEPCSVLIATSDLMPRIRALAEKKSITTAITDQPAEVNV